MLAKKVKQNLGEIDWQGPTEEVQIQHMAPQVFKRIKKRDQKYKAKNQKSTRRLADVWNIVLAQADMLQLPQRLRIKKFCHLWLF